MQTQSPISPALADQRLRPATRVAVYVEPHPVAQMSIKQLAEAVRAGSIPAHAGVMIDQQGPWFPARDVIAFCSELEPTRSAPVAALAVGVPVLLWIGHAAFFGAVGSLPLAMMTALGAVVALVAVKLPALRTRNPGELLSKPVLAVAAIVALGAEGVSTASAIAYRAHERRVDAALNLATSDDCGVKALSLDDLTWLHENDTWHAPSGIDESRASVYDGRLSRCEVKQARVRHEQACTMAAQALATHQGLPATARDIPAADMVLLQRIASRTLGGDDLKGVPLPCADTTSAASVQSAFTSAATLLGPEWLAAGIPNELKSAVGNLGLAPAAADAFRRKVDGDAEATLGSNSTLEALSDTVAACDIVKELTHAEGATCGSARARRQALLAKQDAAQKAKDARCDALKQARDQCTKRCENRLPKDDLGFPDFDKGLDCGEVCEKQVPLSACD